MSRDVYVEPKNMQPYVVDVHMCMIQICAAVTLRSAPFPLLPPPGPLPVSFCDMGGGGREVRTVIFLFLFLVLVGNFVSYGDDPGEYE